MNIIICGAGNIGLHVAAALSKQEHSVVLIDRDERVLEHAARNIDVGTRQGSATDWQLLEELMELSPDLFLSLTNEDEANLVACSIAKNLGIPETLSRVREDRYLNSMRLDFGRLFAVDHFLCPELLVAQRIFNRILYTDAVRTESFSHGAVQMRTMRVPTNWRRSEKTLRELSLPKGVMVGLIRRPLQAQQRGAAPTAYKTLFPHGDDNLLVGDEVTFIGETNSILDLHVMFGTTRRAVKSVVIAGGSLTALHLAKILVARRIDVHIIEKNFERCALLAEQLPEARITHHDATDLSFLQSEKIGNADVFVSCTGKDETDLLAALLAKQCGTDKVLMCIADPSYAPILEEMGIGHAISHRAAALDMVLAITREEAVTSMVTLPDADAEIAEIKVSMDSSIAGIPLRELGPHLPEDFLIAVIQNRGRVMIANGDRILCPGDTAVVISTPKNISEINTLF